MFNYFLNKMQGLFEFFPPRETSREFIAINPTEQKRIPTVRAEILRRDKFCSFPILSDCGELIGIEKTHPARIGYVHHIMPIAFMKQHHPNVDPNHPLNLITLDRSRHNILHTEWIERYGCDPITIRKRVYYEGQAGWVDDYDEALTNITTIRTYDLLKSGGGSDYYEAYADDILGLYEGLDKNFEDKYRYFAGRLNL